MSATPFAILQGIDEKVRQNSAGLPSEDVSQETWTGVGFFVGQHELLTPLQAVAEILDPMDCARLPGVQPWFKGLANVRGNLVPVMDLHHFLFGEALPVTNSTRVITFHDEGANAGLIVNSVAGMRHFHRDEQTEHSSDLDEALKPYVSFAFHRSGESWDVFDYNLLAESEAFVRIAEAS
ncbi:twitching motility protein PilI [gamma proteobacterium HTCC5015]|nr:twitching motility protein PilI [gamma proteobacterium HTCC5015]